MAVNGKKVLLVCDSEKVAPLQVSQEQAARLAAMDSGGGWRVATADEIKAFDKDSNALTGKLEATQVKEAPSSKPTVPEKLD